MTKVRGNTIFIIKKFIRENHSKEELDKVINGTDQLTKKVLTGVIVSNDFYELRAKESLLESFSKVLGKDEMLKCSRYEAKEQLRGLFALVARFISPDMMFNRMQGMWDKIFSEGKIVVKEKRTDGYRIEISGIKLSPVHQQHIEEYIRSIIEQITQRNFKGKIKETKDSTYEIDYVL